MTMRIKEKGLKIPNNGYPKDMQVNACISLGYLFCFSGEEQIVLEIKVSYGKFNP